jgi:protein pelota
MWGACRPGHVLAAHERLAIDKLLITDALFRCSDVKTRAKWVAVVESVRDAQGTVHIFSSMHVSGEQLQNLSGVAAVLRFPLPDLEQMEL